MTLFSFAFRMIMDLSYSNPSFSFAVAYLIRFLNRSLCSEASNANLISSEELAEGENEINPAKMPMTKKED